jgi:hypothetical protein
MNYDVSRCSFVAQLKKLFTAKALSRAISAFTSIRWVIEERFPEMTFTSEPRPLRHGLP